MLGQGLKSTKITWDTTLYEFSYICLLHQYSSVIPDKVQSYQVEARKAPSGFIKKGQRGKFTIWHVPSYKNALSYIYFRDFAHIFLDVPVVSGMSTFDDAATRGFPRLFFPDFMPLRTLIDKVHSYYKSPGLEHGFYLAIYIGNNNPN